MIRWGTPTARWVIAATVLGSGIAFLDGTVVNVALPSIGRDLHTDVAGLQWTLDAYLVTLTAFLLLGGALGDRFGRKRVFLFGLSLFTLASVACAAAPSVLFLVIARAVQGAAARCSCRAASRSSARRSTRIDRPRAIGAWSGLGGVASAIGPFLGGWFIEVWSWRLVFLINVPLAVVTFLITSRHVPESKTDDPAPLDFVGATLASIGLAAACFALIEGTSKVDAAVVGASVVGVVTIARRSSWSKRGNRIRCCRCGCSVPREFSGANGTTLAVYGALSAAMFLVVFELQVALDYSPIAAGASLLPVTILMLTLSARSGALSQRIGPRIPMTVGPIVVGVAMLLFTRIHPGASYWTTVFPAAVVFGLGLACTVAPLTSTVLAAVQPDELGIASGVNNAAARLAGLLAIAVLPAIANIDTNLPADAFTDHVATALRVCAGLAMLGGVVAFLTVRTQKAVTPTTTVSILQPCGDPCLLEEAQAS